MHFATSAFIRGETSQTVSNLFAPEYLEDFFRKKKKHLTSSRFIKASLLSYASLVHLTWTKPNAQQRNKWFWGSFSCEFSPTKPQDLLSEIQTWKQLVFESNWLRNQWCHGQCPAWFHHLLPLQLQEGLLQLLKSRKRARGDPSPTQHG